jgi:hypothetical protein
MVVSICTGRKETAAGDEQNRGRPVMKEKQADGEASERPK